MEDLLSNQDIIFIVGMMAELGIRSLRLTGGEPLLRPSLVELVHALARTPGIEDIALTTNGLLLAEMAGELAAAGLRRVNVSLDSLRPERFARITGGVKLDHVLAGITAAEKAGLTPIKINMVVVRGINDDEIDEMARFGTQRGWHVRFIEVMPVGGIMNAEHVVTAQEIMRRLPPLSPTTEVAGQGPARVYRLGDAPGTVGFVSAVSDHFCDGCNRLRLLADGHLRPCLLHEGEVDLRQAARRRDADDLRRLIQLAVAGKPRGHRLAEGIVPHGRLMAHIGG